MKKFFKFVFKLCAYALTGFGAYKLFTKYAPKPQTEDKAEDDFTDDLKDFELEEDGRSEAK